MRTIIEALKGVPVRGAAAALSAWFVGVTLVAFVVQPNEVVAFGQPVRLIQAAIDTDGALLSSGRTFVALRTGRPDTVRRLYSAGAWLVWPVLGAGCRRFSP